MEIAKLSLWLRTAKPKRKLNSLNNNIKCGNSLIDDPNFEKAFNWGEEFPQVFGNHPLTPSLINEGEKEGFDVVIGNPPYGAKIGDIEKVFFQEKYKSVEYQVNSYVLFYERSINLLKNKGLLGFITPATFTYQYYFKNIREILQKYKQICISKYLYEVFEDADIGDSVTWILQKVKNDETDILIQICQNEIDSLKNAVLKKYADIVNSDATYNLNPSEINLSRFDDNSVILSDIANIIVGIKPYQTNKGKPKQTKEDVKAKKFTDVFKKDDTYIQCIIGKDFHRYGFLQEPLMFLSYGEWLAEPRNSAPFFDEEKIILRQTSDSLIANIDDEKRINLNNVYNIGKKDESFDLKYILSLINSSLMNFIYQNISQEKGRLFAEVKKVYLSKLPIKNITIKEQQPFIEKANQMLTLNKDLQKTKNKFIKELQLEKIPKKLENFENLTFDEFIKEYKKAKKLKFKTKLEERKLKDEWEELFDYDKQKTLEIQTQITQTDKQIDNMVYQLYGLSDEEIKIIEGE